MADCPEDQAEDDTEEDRGGEREGDGPATTLPGEVAGQTAEGKVEPAEDDEEETCEDEDDPDAAEVHASMLRAREHLAGFAQEVSWLAGLGEDTDGASEAAGVLADMLEVRVVAGEDEDAAGGLVDGDVVYQLMAVLPGHGDVAEEELGSEIVGTLPSLFGGVGCQGFVAILREDQCQGVRDEMFVIDNENALHGEPPPRLIKVLAVGQERTSRLARAAGWQKVRSG